MDTGNATSKIGNKITQIQVDIEEVVTAIGEITNTIPSINDHQTIVAVAVEEQTATISEMSRSISEAADGISQIFGSTVSPAQTVKDSRTAVDRMNEQFVQLRVASGSPKKQTEVFKL